MTLTIDQCADAAIAQAEAAAAYAEARRDYQADASEENFLAMGDAHRAYVKACHATEEAVRAHKAYGEMDETTQGLRRQGMFNDEQVAYLDWLASLPTEKMCECGWYIRRDCERGRFCQWRPQGGKS